MEEKSDFVRFHAMQSILTFLPLAVLGWIFGALGGSFLWVATGGWFLFYVLGILIWLLTFILWIVLMLKAYQGEYYKLPVVGDIAEDQL